jgi:hypothetical protein
MESDAMLRLWRTAAKPPAPVSLPARLVRLQPISIASKVLQRPSKTRRAAPILAGTHRPPRPLCLQDAASRWARSAAPAAAPTLASSRVTALATVGAARLIAAPHQPRWGRDGGQYALQMLPCIAARGMYWPSRVCILTMCPWYLPAGTQHGAMLPQDAPPMLRGSRKSQLLPTVRQQRRAASTSAAPPQPPCAAAAAAGAACRRVRGAPAGEASPAAGLARCCQHPARWIGLSQTGHPRPA